MRRVRTKRTSAEQAVARALTNLGARYRRNVRALPGSPDFANRRRGWAVLVHGCFWHAHDCPRGRRPKRNREFWNTKLDRNMERDQSTLDALHARGLNVLTVWECELKDEAGLERRLRALLNNRG